MFEMPKEDEAGRSLRDMLWEMTKRRICEQYDRMEQEAKTFLLMGYEVSELTIVQHADGYQEISPKSALPIEGV